MDGDFPGGFFFPTMIWVYQSFKQNCCSFRNYAFTLWHVWEFPSIWNLKGIYRPPSPKKHKDKVGCPAVDVWPGQSLPWEKGPRGRKKRKKGIMRKRSGGTGTSNPQRHSGKKGNRGEEKKIVQFSGTGESKDNNNTGNLFHFLHSAVSFVPK